MAELSTVSICYSTFTCSQQTHRVGRLCQEVRITKHVLLVDSEAQKGECGVVDVKHKLLLHPHWIQSIISYEGQEEETVSECSTLRKKIMTCM